MEFLIVLAILLLVVFVVTAPLRRVTDGSRAGGIGATTIRPDVASRNSKS